MMKKTLLFSCLVLFSCCQCDELSSYTAAVVEVNPPEDIGRDFSSVANITNQMVEIIESPEIKNVDIIVLPEYLFNRLNTAILLPNSTVFCDDLTAHFVFRNISCAARNAKKYVVIDLLTKVKCSVDDQAFCAYKDDETNIYNMAIVFDRQGAIIAKYRKYNLFGEHGVQRTETPDLTTFRTDFNVTFGVCICFDLLFDWPPNALVERGVRNFVYPTMWFSEIPYLSAVQYQQSWAYTNNVNLLAANINWPDKHCTGSGIYAGRLGALDIVVDQTANTKILIAQVPSSPPSIAIDNKPLEVQLVENTTSSDEFPKYEIVQEEIDTNGTSFTVQQMVYDEKLAQDDMTVFSVQFLDFSKYLIQNGIVCSDEICCHFHIDVSDNGERAGQISYSYAISVFSGHRHYTGNEHMGTGQDVCSLLACVKMNDQNSCGIRYSTTTVQNRYSINKLTLKTELPISRGMKVMPNTLTHHLLPLNTTDFDYILTKLDGGQKYAVTLSLNVPKSDLLTFAIFSRDYKRDITASGVQPQNGVVILTICILASIIWLRSGK